MWRTRLLLLLVSTTVSLAIVIPLGEWYLRHREHTRSTLPTTMPTLYYRHSRFPRALVRGQDYFGWIQVNQFGMRGPETAREKPAGVTRILVAGGSTTFDEAVSGNDNAWPARFDAWLDSLAVEGPVEVLNAGVAGYRVIDNLIWLMTELHTLEPDIVVLLQGHNDLEALHRLHPEVTGVVNEPRPHAVEPRSELRTWLQAHSMFYGKVTYLLGGTRRRLFGRGGGGNISSTRVEMSLAKGVEQFERDVTLFVELCQMIGAMPVLLEPPHLSGAGTRIEDDTTLLAVWADWYNRKPPEETIEGFAKYNAALVRVAERTGAIYQSTADFGLRGLDLYAPSDPIHFNDAGANIMGREMARVFLDRILPRLDSIGAPASVRSDR